MHGHIPELPMCAKRGQLYEMSKTYGGQRRGHKLFSGTKIPSSILPQKRYVILSGAVDIETRAYIKKVFNSPENKHGELIKAILVSEIGATGLDLKYIRETHQMEPYWEATRSVQFVARAARMGSHDLLPREERDVRSYMYLAVPNKKIYAEMVEREEHTIDEQFYIEGQNKLKINNDALKALQEVSIECILFNYENCRVCETNGAKLFTNDPHEDVRAPDKCIAPRAQQEVDVEEVEINGEKLLFNKENGKYYKYSEKYDSYITVDI